MYGKTFVSTIEKTKVIFGVNPGAPYLISILPLSLVIAINISLD